MKRYSSSYVYKRSNFVLLGCDEGAGADTPWYELACVALNIIQRGTPTPIPEKLHDLLGDVPSGLRKCPRPAREVLTHELIWEKTIKGAPDGKSNPALRFYRELLPQALPLSHRFLMAYILPEAAIADIIESCDSRFVEQRVDFYCPRAKLVIEIDGSQHYQAAQSYLDVERDVYLKQHGIETLRISTSELDAAAAANELIERFNFGDMPSTEVSEREELAVFGYEIALRAQVAVLECIRVGILVPSQSTWLLQLVHDQPGIDCDAVVRAAVDDVLDLLENLCALRAIEFVRPDVLLTERADDVCLDLSATKCWSELESATGVVYARNDYYENRDWFRVSCTDPIEYETAIPERAGQVEAALHYFLKYLFGYSRFHQGQVGIIKRALARRATLGILPTGSGKSLCYQMACLLQPCISFVVCPIISLIQDQDVNARDIGICRVGRIDSQMDREGKNKVLEGFGQRRYQFIWISPERFQTKDFRERLREIGNAASYGYAVIDEAHCLSEWGHDFRVSYLKLNDTIQRFCPQAVILALTATASRSVLEDLLVELRITKRDVQTSPSLDRPELTYHVIKIDEQNRAEALGTLLDEINDTFRRREGVSTIFEPVGEDGKDSICGIVFCNTKGGKRTAASCSGVVSLLRSRGIEAGEYHADRGNERARVQQAFIDNEFTVMAATKAFGMGVNKKNVRYTIHDGLPWSIEAFYQEAGRAGRDDERNESECYILFSDDSPSEVVERVFARDTSIEEIRSSVGDLGDDLGTLFFLWTRGHEDIDVEAQAIIAVFKELMRRRDRRGKAVIEFTLVRELMHDALAKKLKPGDTLELHMGTQDALYKLALLGIVRDWTIDYRTKTYEVDVEKIDSSSEEHVKNSLETYIRRHDPQFSFESKRREDQKYVDSYNQALAGNKLVGLVKALLLWTNDHIVYNRRQAIKNMLDQCERRPDKDEFRRYINDFFRLDTENADQLDCIIETANDADIWLRLFTELDDNPLGRSERLKGLMELKAIVALCDRYRESYHANIGLEWATMVARLLSDEFSRDETANLFSFVAQEIGDYKGLNEDEVFDRTVGLIEYASDDAKNAFGAAVVEYAPQRAADVYRRLGDAASLEYLVSSAAEKLRSTWGRVGKK